MFARIVYSTCYGPYIAYNYYETTEVTAAKSAKPKPNGEKAIKFPGHYSELRRQMIDARNAGYPALHVTLRSTGPILCYETVS